MSCRVPPGWYKIPLTFLLYILVQKIKGKNYIPQCWWQQLSESCQLLIGDELASQKVQHKNPSDFHEIKFNPNHSDGLMQLLGKQLHLLDNVLGKKRTSEDPEQNKKLAVPSTDWETRFGTQTQPPQWGFQHPHCATSSSLGYNWS